MLVHQRVYDFQAPYVALCPRRITYHRISPGAFFGENLCSQSMAMDWLKGQFTGPPPYFRGKTWEKLWFPPCFPGTTWEKLWFPPCFPGKTWEQLWFPVDVPWTTPERTRSRWFSRPSATAWTVPARTLLSCSKPCETGPRKACGTWWAWGCNYSWVYKPTNNWDETFYIFLSDTGNHMRVYRCLHVFLFLCCWSFFQCVFFHFLWFWIISSRYWR